MGTPPARAFDDGNPRKGGTFDLVDEESQDLTSTAAAMSLAELDARLSQKGQKKIRLDQSPKD